MISVSDTRFISRLAVRFAALMFISLALSACAQNAATTRSDGETTAAVADKASQELATINPSLREKWGIEIVALRTTMMGMMVDLRYRVLDATKAASLLDLNTKSWLEVKKNGARLDVPHSVKIGELRQSTSSKKIKEGIDYFILFGNPGARYVQTGDEVTLVIGDMTVDSLIVQ